jgi:hypothetical protein
VVGVQQMAQQVAAKVATCCQQAYADAPPSGASLENVWVLRLQHRLHDFAMRAANAQSHLVD